MTDVFFVHLRVVVVGVSICLTPIGITVRVCFLFGIVELCDTSQGRVLDERSSHVQNSFLNTGEVGTAGSMASKR